MKRENIQIGDYKLPLYTAHNLVIGSGAASLNAAVHLDALGENGVLVVTNDLGGGISNNAGSDKQTYYKLSISGESRDSPREMAKTYFEKGGMHGDLALVESALSVREFFHLVELGVDFPFNRYGEYGGYKTDHDPKGRGTSAGPWTSQQMFSRLKDRVQEREVELREEIEIIGLLKAEKGKGNARIIGALGINKNRLNGENFGFEVYRAENVIFGVGGPGGLYEDSVYPRGHVGSIGLALEAGVQAKGLTEGQFGLASTDFRWNLSGTYQQVIPTYYSVDPENPDERKEFLNEYFSSMENLARAIFLKGYQWPFDAGKTKDHGSSLIDLLVYNETRKKGREVYLDYTKNPSGEFGLEDFTPEILSGEAMNYLENSNALFGRPIDRLKKMNPQAVELYRQNGIDLEQDPLKAAVCAQHSNGGLSGNIWWESNLKHFFPVGEVNGTHGVSRPGGSALNAGQVGGLRAAQYISKQYDDFEVGMDQFENAANSYIAGKIEKAESWLSRSEGGSGNLTVTEARKRLQARMSQYFGPIRKVDEVKRESKKAESFNANLDKRLIVSDRDYLPAAFQASHLALTHMFYARAISDYVERGGGSRGSYMVVDEEGDSVIESLPEELYFRQEDTSFRDRIQKISRTVNGKLTVSWEDRREIPEEKFWFETAWKEFREGEIYN